jgi:hypothetical protein
MIDAAWQGKAQFHEVIFGTWTSYAFLVWMWESGFEKNLPEWKYVLITFLGASVYLINHYFQLASFWLWLLNGYSVVFIVVYYKVAVQPMSRHTTKLWKSCATISSILFTVVFILLEQVARRIVSKGYSDFWIMLVSYFGFLWLILWRARSDNNISTTCAARLEKQQKD